MRLVDVRAGRFEQGVIVVVLLAGFVFSLPWSIPLSSALAVFGAVLGERSPLQQIWRAVFAPRLRSAGGQEPMTVARTQILLVAAGLVLATLVLLVGSVGLASVLAAVVAIVAALSATGVVSLAAELQRRSSRG